MTALATERRITLTQLYARPSRQQFLFLAHSTAVSIAESLSVDVPVSAAPQSQVALERAGARERMLVMKERGRARIAARLDYPDSAGQIAEQSALTQALSDPQEETIWDSPRVV
jgi:hypothetical protein